MAISYSYKPGSNSRVAEYLRKNSRNIGMSVLALSLIFSFSVLSGRITGFVTYTADLESVLNETTKQLNTESRLRAECDSDLTRTASSLSECNGKLTSSQSYMVACEKDRDELKSYSDSLNSLFSSCDTERADVKIKYANETENYKQAVKNSVKAICCSFGDAQSGTVRLWEMENNRIVCTGNYTVNCTTGTTNY